MKKLMTLVLSCVLGLNVLAQGGSSAPLMNAEKGMIKGLVKENSSKVALEYANIKVFSLPDSALVTGTITNVSGSFEIKDLNYGNYFIVAEFIGYKKITIPNILISKESKVADIGEILLEPSAEQLGEVSVTAEKSLVSYQIDKKVVNIDKKLSASGGNLVDALENTPSVQIDAEGNVSLRGSTNFTVLIDGKPTALSGNDALKQIPASAVANVEVITNPSAKFDPDGSAGILNIIMKKEYKSGMSGILNASVGSHFQHNGDFNLNFRREKINFFVGGSYADRRRYPVTEISNEQVFTDESKMTIQRAEREQKNKNYNVKGGLDFFINSNTTLTLSGEYGHFGMDMFMPSKSVGTILPANETVYYLNTSHLTIGGNYINSNFSFDKKFDDKGHKLVLGVTYSNWDGNVTSDIKMDTTNNTWETVFSSTRYRTIQHDLENEWRTKIDYTYPINEKYTLEAGYQGRYKNVATTYNKENFLNASNSWSDDAQFANGMDFTQNIQSLYFTLSGKVIGLDAKLGLRSEYSTRLLAVNEPAIDYELDLLDWFPTVHFSKKFNEKQELQASYTRRINRPDEWNLNPFPIYADNDISQSGNPNLKPEYVDSYELNFMQYLKKGFVSFEAYYRQTGNGIEQSLLRDSETGIIRIMPDNLSKNFAYGVELSSNLNLTKWFSLYASANLYSYNVSGDIVSSEIDTRSLNSDFVLNSNFTLKTGTRIQISGFYNAPKVTSQGNQSEMYGVNTAIRQEFLKKKMTLSLRVNDVFQTMRFKFNSTEVAEDYRINTKFTFKMDSPTVMLSLSYTLNNYKKRAEEEGPQQNIGGGGLF